MKRFLVFLCLCLALLANSGLAQDSGGVVSGDTLTIYYQTGDLADGTDASKVNWPKSIDHFIALANQGKCEFFVEASNDTVHWRWVERILRGTKSGVGVNIRRVNRTNDAAATAARMKNALRLLKSRGLERKAVRYLPVDGDRVFIKIYPVMTMVSASPQVVERIIEKPAAPFVLPKFDLPKLPKLGLSLHVGATSTWKNVAPMAALSLQYKNSIVQAYGMHSLFFPREQNALSQDREVYDQGVGLLVGKQIGRPLWLLVGYERQETVLDDRSDQSSKNVFWFQGCEFGLMWFGDNHFVTLTGLYGHRKEWQSDWNQVLETNTAVRLAVGVRFLGGK